MNKHDYHIARKAWKAEYESLTAEIQEAKRQRKEAAKAFAALGNIRCVSYKSEDYKLNLERIKACSKYNDLHSKCIVLKQAARNKLTELEALKGKAREAYQLRRAA